MTSQIADIKQKPIEERASNALDIIFNAPPTEAKLRVIIGAAKLVGVDANQSKLHDLNALKGEIFAKATSYLKDAVGKNALTAEDITSMQKALEIVSGLEALNAEPAKSLDIFAKYNFKIKDNGLVEFTLPKGSSYVELFDDCNNYCKENPNRARYAVYRGKLYELTGVTAPAIIDITQTIEAVMPNSTHKTRKDQEELVKSLGFSMPSIEALASVAALYYAKTGQDLLKDLWVRTSTPGLALDSSSDGLDAVGGNRVACSVDGVACAVLRN